MPRNIIDLQPSVHGRVDGDYHTSGEYQSACSAPKQQQKSTPAASDRCCAGTRRGYVEEAGSYHVRSQGRKYHCHERPAHGHPGTTSTMASVNNGPSTARFMIMNI